LDLFTQLPPAAGMEGGGVGNALVGTLLMIGIAAVLSVPFGILAAVFLAEFSRPVTAPQPLPFATRVGATVLAVAAGIGTYVLLTVSGRYDQFTAPLGGAAAGILLLLPVWFGTEKIAEGVRFAAKVLTGLPSILAGVFAYELVVLTTGK